MSKGLIISLIGALVLLFASVVGLGFIVLNQVPAAAATAQNAGEVQTEPADTTPALSKAAGFLELKKFVTDLADQDRLRYIEVSVAIGFKDTVALEEAQKLQPQIRDLVLSLLRTQKAADLAGPTGKEQLAEVLKAPLAKLIKEGMQAVYITDMVIQ